MAGDSQENWSESGTLLVCAACNRRCSITGYDPSEEYRCNSCGGALEPLSQLVTIREEEAARVADSEAEMDAADVRASSSFGKYTILRQLGKGGMGVVYEALDTRLGRKVALKMRLPASAAGTQEAVSEEKRFVREARLSANLPRHANIVQVYEGGAVEGKLYLATELIDGQPMDEWKKGGGVTVRRQVEILRDVALAIHHAHEHKLIHRDIKPQNILLDSEGHAYVTDFGLAKTLGQQASISVTGAGMVVGTPAYMSPEQARGLKSINHATDIWSLGVMLYEVLTGHTPFTGDSAMDVLVKTVHDEVIPPSKLLGAAESRSLDKTLENICVRALAKKPENRYETARDFAEDLSKWLRGEEVKVPMPGRKLWKLFYPPYLWAVGAAAILIAGIGVLLPGKTGRDRPPDSPKPQAGDNAQETGVPPDAVEFAGHWYRVMESEVTWHEARSRCQAMGGHLACIETPEEQGFLEKLPSSPMLRIWVGGTDEGSEGVWKWVNGRSVTFADWRSGEPNNEDNAEHCMVMEGLHGYKWNDDIGSKRFYFICEWDDAGR